MNNMTYDAAAMRGKTIVVKYGGNAMLNDELKAAVADDVVFMRNAGVRVVLAHGGGPEIEAMLKKVSKQSRFVSGQRYTDEETMEIVQMVLCGKLNKDITALLVNAGANAIGLCGIDNALFKAERDTRADLGLVGKISAVNDAFLRALIDAALVPVISSVALGSGAERGRALNINADIAAAAVAAALRADELVLMTDIAGLLRDVNDQKSLIARADTREIAELKRAGVISKGMIPKIECCETALAAGVAKARILDGRVAHVLLDALFAGKRAGTIIEAAGGEPGN